MLFRSADALDALERSGASISRVRLVGGAAASEAVRQIAAMVFARPVIVPAPGEYVADGAARQAAWALTGNRPDWPLDSGLETYEAKPTPAVRERYATARNHWIAQIDAPPSQR